MGSAENLVGSITYMMKSTAATNVSFTTNLKTDNSGKSFDNILSTVNKNQNTYEPKTEIATSKDTKGKTLEGKNGKLDVTAEKNKASEKSDVNTKPEKVVDIKETNGKEADKELQNAMNEDGKKILKEISEMTDISEDEIIAAMQMIGLFPVDLLNPENVIEVVNLLDTNENGVGLIVDSELYSSLQEVLTDVSNLREELTEQFNITPEELDSAIESFEDEINPALAELKATGENSKLVSSDDATEKDVLNNEPEVKVELKIPVKETEEVVTDYEPAEETVETVSEKNPSNNKNEDKDSSKNQPNLNLFEQFVDKITESVEATENSSSLKYTDRVQMENIIKQITEKITVSAGEEQSSIELSLHPASLGKLNILLTNSKDGITAKFTAQNEIVKEAVESQMTTLMQKFNEQGVKVTSVEVTIASHAFEQNLQQNNNQEEAREQLEKNRKPLRRINLSEIDEEIEEEMSEAELIAAQMMAYNGNMIDFSA